MKKYILLGIGILLVSSLAFYFLVLAPQNIPVTKPSEVKNEVKPVEKVERVVAVPLQYQFVVGDHFIYDFNYETSGTMLESNAQKQVPSPILFKIAGKLHRKVYEVKNQNAFVGYSLFCSTLLLGEQDKNLVKQFVQALQTEIYVTMTERGIIQKWYFPQSIPGNLCNIVKSLLLNSQVIVPIAAQAEWTTEETDQNGLYRARYTQKEGRIYKTKLEYTQTVEALKIHSCKSTNTIDFNVLAGHIKKMAFEENVQYQAMNILTTSKIQIQMDLVSKSNDPTLAASLESKLKKEGYTISSSATIEGQEEINRILWRKQLGNMTWEDFTKGLSEAKERKDCADLIYKLRAWMQLNPTKLYLVAQKILESKELTPGIYAMISALSSVEPHGQDVLVDVIKKRSTQTEYVYEAVQSLAFVSKPTDATLRLFQDLSKNYQDESIRGSALLSLGTLAGRFLENDPAKTALLVYDLEAKLQNPQDKNEKILLIDALGNAGSESSLTHLSPLVQDSDVSIRTSALYALRFIPDTKADELLLNALKDAKDFSTQKSAWEALAYRKPTPTLFAAVNQQIASEKSDDLKTRGIQVLWNMRQSFPEAETIVRQYANSDPSEKVRYQVKSMMLASGVRY